MRTPALLTASLAALALSLTGTGAAHAANPSSSDATAGILAATSARTATDVWSAGYAQAVDTTITPLTEHWNGKAWKVTATPLPAGRSHGQLTGIAAVSAKRAWAVGSTTSDTDGSSRTLAEHWTGKKWQVVPTAEPDQVSSSYLQAVTAISDTDVWAVGYFYGGASGDGGTIIEHWDGTSWTLAANADPAGAFHASMQGVSALSTKNVWASGFFYDETGAAVTLVEHWNGKKWKTVDSPNSPASPDTELHAVSAISTNDVWATGFTTLNGSTYLPLTEHWDGAEWSIVDSAVPAGSLNTYLYAVDGLTRKNVWATGYYFKDGAYQTLAEHWTGKKWKVVSTPNTAGAGSNYLFGVSMISGSDVWTAGGSFVSADIPFMQHWDGDSWTMVPVA